MQNKYLSLLMFFLIVSQTISCGKETNKNNKTAIKIGEYLSNDYISHLNKYKSPLKSLVRGRPQMLSIQRDSSGIAISIISNFHEGSRDFLIQNDGKIIDEFPGHSNKVIEVIDTESIKIGFDSFPPCIFIYVNDARTFAARKCLVGNYMDSNNNKFDFYENGTADFAGKRIHVRIGLDYPPSFKYDYFSSDTTEYGFNWRDSILEIYGTDGSSIFEDGDIVEPPIYKLKQADAPKK